MLKRLYTQGTKKNRKGQDIHERKWSRLESFSIHKAKKRLESMMKKKTRWRRKTRSGCSREEICHDRWGKHPHQLLCAGGGKIGEELLTGLGNTDATENAIDMAFRAGVLWGQGSGTQAEILSEKSLVFLHSLTTHIWTQLSAPSDTSDHNLTRVVSAESWGLGYVSSWVGWRRWISLEGRERALGDSCH